ncbi:CaiB/BaiF CoA transferase family protein [Noviherbaspirillum massiliense]|uniref:CaiB/BaiF CoA transferase family protein n=1 Tax=Noviherbaspirillum massiliense TaxID=1465823 RepID=UPI000310353B|nr:CaiB/BaiF CoA-transferase family protein [Noviherbaspirillum massiliense]
MGGPLQGLKVVEIVGIGPGPFCAMMLADMGAEVIRIDQKPGPSARKAGIGTIPPEFDVLARGRPSAALDLKNPAGKRAALDLISRADALIEGFRPGVMERLGLGPDACLKTNPKLVYGRMTGWGQGGTLAHAAGHDLNYVALSGMLHAIGRRGEPPPPPLNLVGDFGGGGLLLAFGMVCAMLEAQGSGKGQVVDAAMTDGSALLGTMMYGMKAAGMWTTRRESNLLDGAAHFYDCYACADGKFISIGAIEPQFYAQLLERIGIEDEGLLKQLQEQMNPRRWPELKQALAAIFRKRTRDEWCALLEGSDACFAPVLDMDEAPQHPHNQARATFIDIAGVTQPAPAPRFSRTPAEKPEPASAPGADTERVLAAWGFNAERIAELRAAQAIN